MTGRAPLHLTFRDSMTSPPALFWRRGATAGRAPDRRISPARADSPDGIVGQRQRRSDMEGGHYPPMPLLKLVRRTHPASTIQNRHSWAFGPPANHEKLVGRASSPAAYQVQDCGFAPVAQVFNLCLDPPGQGSPTFSATLRSRPWQAARRQAPGGAGLAGDSSASGAAATGLPRRSR